MRGVEAELRSSPAKESSDSRLEPFEMDSFPSMVASESPAAEVPAKETEPPAKKETEPSVV